MVMLGDGGIDHFVYDICWVSLMMLCRTCKFMREWALRVIQRRCEVRFFGIMHALPITTDHEGVPRFLWNTIRSDFVFTRSFEMLKYMQRFEGYRKNVDRKSDDLLWHVMQGTGVIGTPMCVWDKNIIACIRFGQVVDSGTFCAIANECGWECIQVAREKLDELTRHAIT